MLCETLPWGFLSGSGKGEESGREREREHQVPGILWFRTFLSQHERSTNKYTTEFVNCEVPRKILVCLVNM